MIGYLSADWFGKALVLILSFLNSAIYGLVELVFQTFSSLSNITLFNDTIIGEFTDRIYVILGIFMLFKFSFSLLTSIVNPDALVDKEKGMGKIISRTIIALIMLVMVPTVFSKAMEWQTDIALTVPQLVLGRKIIDPEEEQGDKLAAVALSAFVVKNEQCADSDLDENLINIQSVAGVIDLVDNTCSNPKKQFQYEFNGFISMIAGIIMVVLLAGYCIDIAVRVIKLGVLRILAPIPIMSYVDPKSSKGGAFGNWTKECISTYVELFIKLTILYFVVYILGNIASGNSLFNLNGESNGFVNLFLILGAFFFMGKAADFICNILGIKKPEKSASSGFLKGAGGLFAGMGLGAIGATITGGGLAGVASATLDGAATGMSGKPMGAFNRGRDIATQFKSGGKETKYTPFYRRAQDKLRANQAAHDIFGVDTEREAQEIVDKAKATMLEDNARYEKAVSLLNSGKPFDFDGEHYETQEDFARFRSKIYDGKNSLMSIKNQSESKYGDLKEAAQYAGFKGLNKTSTTKAGEAMEYFNNHAPTYRATNVRTETVSDAVNRAANVHEAPTHQEHIERYDALNEVFNSPISVAQQETIEREIPNRTQSRVIIGDDPNERED